MVGLFKTTTPMSFDSLLKSGGGDGYIHIVGNDDVAHFVLKNLGVSPAVATELVNSYDGHPKPSKVAEPVDSTAMRNILDTLRGVKMVPTHPDSSRESVMISAAGKQNKDTYPKNSASKAEILQSPRSFPLRDVAPAKKLQETRFGNRNPNWNEITIRIMLLLSITAFICSSDARAYPGGGSQSANVTSIEKEKPEDDARYPHCWQLTPTPAPTSPAPINDDKKEKEKLEDDAVYLQCLLLASASAPTSPAPVNDDKKVKEKPKADAMHLQCRRFAPTLAPTSPAPINDDKKEKEKPEDGAVYLKCSRLAPTSALTSAAHVNDNKKDNLKLYICGYPCCGLDKYRPCNWCCPVHATVYEAGNGGGDGRHGGGDGHN